MADPKLIVDWKRPPRHEPQASLGRFAPDLEAAQARRARERTRGRGPPRERRPRQSSLDFAGDSAGPGETVALELRGSARLTSLHMQRGEPRPSRRPDDAVREALLSACEEGAERDAAVIEAARECAVPASALSFVEALLADLVLEGRIVDYGNVLYTRRPKERKVVAVEVGEDDLMDLLSRGHRVLELK